MIDDALQLITRLVPIAAGVWMLLHFTCMAAFLKRQSCWTIQYSVILSAASGMYLMLAFLGHSVPHQMAALVCATVSLSCFVGALWFNGIKVSKLHEVNEA